MEPRFKSRKTDLRVPPNQLNTMFYCLKEICTTKLSQQVLSVLSAMVLIKF